MATKPDNPVYLVSHTHWDREWYLPFDHTRALLIKVMDGLIDTLEHESDFQAFYLDGQAIVIDDYLAIRRHREAALKGWVAQGRLRIGPWYVASDVVLVSGESLIRNLRYGLRRCREFGSPTMIGYMPDQFGHIAQMPQILNGFGINSAVVGRGRNRGETPNEFIWESPDGSQVLTIFLNTWYSNARNIPQSLDEATTYLIEAAAKAGKDSTGPYTLLLNGCDHLQVDRHVGAVVRYLRDKLGWTIAHTGLEEFLAAVRNSGVKLSVWHGEMRADQGGRLDAGTLSARMPLKSANFRLLSYIEGVVEPLCAFVAALGAQPDTDVLYHIWLRTLQNHPHDSICGCSIDAVAQEMTTRFATTHTLAEVLAASELRHLGALVQAKCRLLPGTVNQHVGDEAAASGYLLYIPAGISTGWVHLANVEIPIAPSARSPLKAVPNPERYQDTPVPMFCTPDGKQLPLQVLSWERGERLCVDISHLPEVQPVYRYQVAFALEAAGHTLTHIDTKLGHPLCEGRSIVTGSTSLENQYLRVDVATDGTLNVLHKDTGHLFTDLCLFEDGGDAGDTYHYVKPPHDRVVCGGGTWSAEVAANGPLLGAIVIRRTMRIPIDLEVSRIKRSAHLIDVDVELHVQLRYGSPFVECRVVITNRAYDHRLRVLFPNGPCVSTMRSLSAFASVDRPLQPSPNWARAASTRPQIGWTSLSDSDITLTILSGDLPEVEAIPTNGGVALALTLLRCVGAVSRRTAMPAVLPAPEAQLLGTHDFSFAIYPHATQIATGTENPKDLTPNQALALLVGAPVMVPTDAIQGYGRVQPCTLVTCSQANFVITAIEPAPPEYNANGLVVRGWSAATQPINVNLQFGLPLASVAYRTDLAGNRLGELVVEHVTAAPGADSVVTFWANPGEIVTVLIPVRDSMNATL